MQKIYFIFSFIIVIDDDDDDDVVIVIVVLIEKWCDDKWNWMNMYWIDIV